MSIEWEPENFSGNLRGVALRGAYSVYMLIRGFLRMRCRWNARQEAVISRPGKELGFDE